MTENVEDLAKKTEEISKNEQKLEFLSLSCPRASEYVLRTKKIDEKEVTCQRGNAEILDEFFKILESSEIEMLKFHLLAVQPEDYEAFKKNLAKCDSYQVKWIVFNQSVYSQLIIDFSLKSSNLECLLVRGYNQKYPCNQTDYLINVKITDSSLACRRHMPRACKKGVLPPNAEIVKSQIPLMCKPIEWSYQEREQLLTEKIPEDLFHSGFIHNSEFFFVESGIDYGPSDSSPKSEVFNSENTRFMDVYQCYDGVCCSVKRRDVLNQMTSSELSVVLNFHELNRSMRKKTVDKTWAENALRMRSLLLQSDEERDLYPNQKTVMDMPLMVIDKILDNLTFSERLPFRGSCRQLYTFPGSQKHVVEACTIDNKGGKAFIEGRLFIGRVGEEKEFWNMVLKNAEVVWLHLETPHVRIFEELEDMEPIEVETLIVDMNRETHEASMKFIVEKCEGAVDSIQMNCQEVDIDFKNEDYLELILSAREVRITRVSTACAMEGLEAYVERYIVSGEDCTFVLQLKCQSAEDRVSLEKFQETYPERIISKLFCRGFSTVRLRTDDVTKHILMTSNDFDVSGKVIPADYVQFSQQD